MDTVKIGWGRREISVNEPVSLPGQMYLRISEGIHDPTYATALCVDGGAGQDTVIFCACDREGFYADVVELVKARVKEMRPELPVQCIIMSCTHTHDGAEINDTPEMSPDGKPIYSGAKYREFFVQMCAEAICQAWDDRAEGGLTYGYGYAVVGHSRRVIYSVDEYSDKPEMTAPNGYGVMYGNTNREIFSHYEAGADHFVNLLYTFDAAGKLTGILVNVPCPSQLAEHFKKMSSDYWNEVRELVGKKYGADVYILPQCAAAGDLSPRILHYSDAQVRRMELKYGLGYDPKKVGAHLEDEYRKVMAERYDIAERIVSAIDEVLCLAKKDIKTQVTVRHNCADAALARRMITDEEKKWCEDNITALEQKIAEAKDAPPEKLRSLVSSSEIISGRNRQAIERYAIQHENPTLTVPLHVASIGDVAFASNPFELYMDYMHRMQSRSPFMQTFVIQMAGFNNQGYLATERGMHNKGYSASMFCNRVSAQGGQQMVDITVDMLKDLKSKDCQ